MRLQSQTLRSKVARRIFVVFLVCAVIPFTGLFLTLYYQVSTLLKDRDQEQLRALAKIIGMELFEKLTLLESGLKIVGSQTLVSDGVPNRAVIESLPSNPGDRWKSIVLLSSSGQPHALLGEPGAALDFSPSDRRMLAGGKTLLKVVSAASGASRIFISLSARPKETGSDILVGEIENSYLWDFEKSRLLPPYVNLCVIDQSGIRLMCDSQASAHLLVHTKSTSERGTVSDIEWKGHRPNSIASQWSLPLKFEFQTPGWIIALETSTEGAFASLAEVKKPFFLGVVVSLGVSILFAIFSIRKRLVPVERLQEGTRRIAEKDFSFRVNIRSNDEFEELAGSVNAMAHELGRQFHTLTTKAEIDRAVLSLLSTDAIVRTVLSRLMGIFPCDAAAILVFGAAAGATDHFYIIKPDRADRWKRHQAVHLQPDERSPLGDGLSRVEIPKGEHPLLRQIADARNPLVFNEKGLVMADSRLTGLNGVKSMMAAPLMIQENILAILIFYSGEPDYFGAQELDSLGTLTKQVAVAIYNARLFETTVRQAAELEKSNRAKDEFLGIVSHELRTPLNVILGYLSLVTEGMLGDFTDEQSRALGTMAKHSKDLLEMIESIMDATKLEAGAVMTEIEQVDLVSLLDDLRSQYEPSQTNDVTLSWSYARALPRVQTDHRKLKQILQNLIGNAVKFTQKGYVAVSASYPLERSIVEFRVEDTGSGIPAESQALIFEMFHQVDSSRTRAYGGVGLGLYIVKKFAALIGAEVSVKSESGRGSIFTVTLPLVNPNASSVTGVEPGLRSGKAEIAHAVS